MVRTTASLYGGAPRRGAYSWHGGQLRIMRILSTCIRFHLYLCGADSVKPRRGYLVCGRVKNIGGSAEAWALSLSRRFNISGFNELLIQ